MPPLLHIHLPSLLAKPFDYPPYSFAVRAQEHLRRRLLDHKDRPSPSPPRPAIITFSPTPTYTLGRSQKDCDDALSLEQVARLRAPIRIFNQSWGNGGRQSRYAVMEPVIETSPRGGLTTYHGPGQLVIWPVIDLHTPNRQIGVAEYARLLEDTTIFVLDSTGALPRLRRGIAKGSVDSSPRAFTTSDPGVWIDSRAGCLAKVAALGVHLRRHVTALGIAINVDMPAHFPIHGSSSPLPPPIAAEDNPWRRFVPCGLAGRGVTSVRAEMGDIAFSRWSVGEKRCKGEKHQAVVLRGLARAWVEEFARRVGNGDAVEHAEVKGRGSIEWEGVLKDIGMSRRDVSIWAWRHSSTHKVRLRKGWRNGMRVLRGVQGDESGCRGAGLGRISSR